MIYWCDSDKKAETSCTAMPYKTEREANEKFDKIKE